MRGSGKTSYMLRRLKEQYNNYYDEIYWLSPSSFHDPKVSETLSKIKTRKAPKSERQLTPEEKLTYQMYEALGIDIAKKKERHVNKVYVVPDEDMWIPIIEKLGNLEPNEKRRLLVLDDMAWFENLLKSAPVNKLFFNARHVHVDIWLSIQYIKCIGPRVRSNITHLSIYSLPNQGEIKTLMLNYPMRKDGKLLSDDEWLEEYNKATSVRYRSLDMGSL